MGSVTTPGDDKMIRAQVFDQCRWPDICCNELEISGRIESENGLEDIQKMKHEKKPSVTHRKSHNQRKTTQSILSKYVYFSTIMKTFASQQTFSVKRIKGFRVVSAGLYICH